MSDAAVEQVGTAARDAATLGMGTPRLLVLSASTGGGHMSAARAVAKAASAAGLHAPVADALDYGPRAFRAWFAGGYEALVRYCPAAWGRLYRDADRPGFDYRFQTMLDTACMAGLEALVDRERPDWVVCTHSLPQPRLARLRASGRRFGIAVVVTDFYPHRMWLRGAPDHFFVPGDYTRDELERRRPGASAITTVTGIPINPVFARPVDRRDARARLGLDLETPFILVSSGFIGGGPVADVVGAISSLPVPCQVAVVCGSNRAAFQRVRIAAEAPGATTVRCEGKLSQDEFALRLQAADLVIGKPGGLTMSECLACGAPLIVYGPLVIPGQEEGNAEYLQQVGAGLCVRNAGELRGVVGDLLALPDRLARMRAAALAAAKPDAAGAVVRSLRAL